MHLLNDFEFFKLQLAYSPSSPFHFIKMKKHGNTLCMLLQIIDGVMYIWYYNNIIIDKKWKFKLLRKLMDKYWNEI